MIERVLNGDSLARLMLQHLLGEIDGVFRGFERFQLHPISQRPCVNIFEQTLRFRLDVVERVEIEQRLDKSQAQTPHVQSRRRVQRKHSIERRRTKFLFLLAIAR